MKAVITNFTGGRENWGCQATSHNLYRYCEGILKPLGFDRISTVPFPPGHILDEFHGRFFGDRIKRIFSRSDVSESDLKFLEKLVISRFGEAAERVRDADLVLFQGEGSIGPARHYRQMRLFGLPFVASRLWKKPVVSINQTLAVNSPSDANALRNICAGFHLNAVREAASIEQSRSIGLDDTLLCPDMAFCDMFEKNERDDTVRPYFCVTGSAALGDYDLARYCESIERIANEMEIRPQVLISKSNDRPLVEELNRRMSGEINVVSSRNVPNYRDMLKVVRDAKFVIGGRYHTSISALSQATPVILTPSNSHKSSGLGKLIGLDLPVVAPDDAEGILSRARETIESYQAKSLEIRRTHEDLKQKIEEFTKLFLESLETAGFPCPEGSKRSSVEAAFQASDAYWRPNDISRGLAQHLAKIFVGPNIKAFDWAPLAKNEFEGG